MQNILIKTYAYLESSDLEALKSCYENLITILNSWYLDDQLIEYDQKSIFISHEGEYFPVDEVVLELAKCISEESKGKLDYLDLEAWTLTRFFFDLEHNKHIEIDKRPYSNKSSLNHAISMAQEKCQQYKCNNPK